ncbi:MAG TPA: archaeal proteasome endopeptidase complex subunit alpha [Nautiliaceae bacterium]|nr:archaeal proteasome endopeptidase complex subunit alpha [Nautiliaceae bacterium]
MSIYSHQVMGYDRALTTFSPDGRLLQVEYAREAVKAGTMGFAIKFKDGILLAGEKRIINDLVVVSSIEKISKIDDKIYAIAAGLGGDGKILIDKARFVAKQHKFIYGTPADISYIVREIANLKQVYTQIGGVRPFGVSIIFAGIDISGKRIFVTEPSGIYYEYKAVAIGSNSDKVNKLLSEKYKDDMSEEEVIELAKEIIKQNKEHNNFEVLIVKEDEVKELEFKDLDPKKKKKNNKKSEKK